MRKQLTTVLLSLFAATSLAAQASAVLIGETTYGGLTEQRGDFGVAGPASGGGATMTIARSFLDTLWISSLEARIPAAARVSVDFEVRQFGATGVGVALGNNDDESLTPVLVMLSASGMLSVRDRTGSVIIAPRAVAGIGTTGPIHLGVEVRGSALSISVNGGPAVTGVAPSLVDGKVEVLAWGGSDFTVRRVRLERLVGVPLAQQVLRTSTSVAVPVIRPSRYFNNERDFGGSLVTDTVLNSVTLAAPDTTDRTAFAVRLGRLPAAVRLETDVSMPRTCRQKIAGLSFGGRGGAYYTVLLMPQVPPLFSMALYRYRDEDLTLLSGATVWSNPFATPAETKHLAVEIRGRSIGWSVNGGRVEQVQVDEEVSGFIGVAAGPGCTVRYANLKITPLS